MPEQSNKAYNSQIREQEFELEDTKSFIDKLLNFCAGHEVFCFLTSNDFYKERELDAKPYYHDFDVIAGIDAKELFTSDTRDSFFEGLQKFHADAKSPLFGYFGYDLKNQVEKLVSEHPDNIDLPDGCFFAPEITVWIRGSKAIIRCEGNLLPDAIFNLINAAEEQDAHQPKGVQLVNRIGRENYIDTVEKLRNHIIEGDVYEINFCQEFYAEDVDLDPLGLFKKLIKISPNPFAAFMKIKGRYVLCSSMERFLKKQGNKLISQPIKGTIRKSLDPEEDVQLQEELLNDEKERAENVMIVDLVRNDLAKSSIPGSVKVEELFGIYPFTQVHQMISTVTSTINHETSWIQAIKNAFPMGSMTGAPKVRTMQLIEQYESTKRGLYSGAIGYMTPEGDFDLNVVIRTFIYNPASKYLSLHVGSAITYDSIPEKEYEECLVKIKGLKKALEGK